jgi:hypothetical protein
MTATRPLFVVTLQGRGTDDIRHLRNALKTLGKRGLRCISATETNTSHTGRRTGREGTQERHKVTQEERKNPMPVDLAKYRGSKFIKLDGFKGPQTKTIAGIVEGKFDKPDVIFTDGSQMGLNATNCDWLIETFGSTNGDCLIDEKVELYVGQTKYQGKTQDSILMRLPNQQAQPKPDHEQAEAIAAKAAQKKPPITAIAGDMDDEIPF